MASEYPPQRAADGSSRRRTVFLTGAALALLVAALVGLLAEARGSRLQALFFSHWARSVSWHMASGAAPELWLPQAGPYDQRLGYTRIESVLPRLALAGYAISAQARQSAGFRELVARGYYPIYREKSQAGLTLLDRSGEPVYANRYPERQYRDFAAIPQVLVDALLYVENRDLLDAEHPRRNPAVDWSRLGRAALGQTLRALELEDSRAGGSTLATQIEKFRHSPGGRTRDADDKLKQMVSAALRAYLDGEDTRVARQRIVVDYLNSVPLAGLPGYGEVMGLGDGLWAWYGRDFSSANRLLADPAADPAERGQAFREVLSLIVAQRRPSHLLLASSERLERLTDSYVRLLAGDRAIPPALRDAALRARLLPARRAREADAVSFVERKAVNDARGALGELLGVDDPYALDRFDLTVRTTLDATAQRRVTAQLGRLGDADFLRCAGFRERRLLDRGAPGGVNYSVTLYERAPLGNLLRVQADNLDQPLDINAGTKLDLGSSAKLRTLVSYLNVIADLHRRYAGLDPDALGQIPARSGDRLSRWAVAWLRDNGGKDLTAMLEAAMERHYSANPNETFFTGGGVHRFANFKHEDDGRNPTVADALEQSINLAFIRIMRDIVHYHAYEAENAPARALRDGDERARQDFLNRFAEREGLGFLRSFWHKYRDLSPADRLELLADSVPSRPAPLAAAFLAVQPDADFATFLAFMRERLGDKAGSEPGLRRVYALHATGRFNLSDRGYLARVHPLELWLVAHLHRHPEAGLREVVAASSAERREASRWLFATRFRHAQQLRIDIIVEVAAFERIADEWRRLGYPFEHLVPSLATAIGSSADRPAALAELMGIVLSDGLRRPTVRIDQLHFAAQTPYDTLLERRAEGGHQVLPPTVAQVVRRALRRVVDHGTAKRLAGSYRDADNQALVVGGKTGTGDHRFQTVGADGSVRGSRVMNRAATFAFYLGDRFYGVVTAFVPGAKAAAYDFTSALPVQLLKTLQPALKPLIAGGEELPVPCLEGAPGAAHDARPRNAARAD